jgi:hypothetical protein
MENDEQKKIKMRGRTISSSRDCRDDPTSTARADCLSQGSIGKIPWS